MIILGSLESAYWPSYNTIGVIWTFCASCYCRGATGEYPLKIGDFAPTGPVDSKFQVEGVAPTNDSSSQKTRLNVLSCGIKIWTDLSSVLSQSTRLTDRETGSFHLIAIPRLHSMQRGKNQRQTRQKYKAYIKINKNTHKLNNHNTNRMTQ